MEPGDKVRRHKHVGSLFIKDKLYTVKDVMKAHGRVFLEDGPNDSSFDMNFFEVIFPFTINLSNTKIWIGDNPELSKKIQKRAFELGWKWGDGLEFKYIEGYCLYFYNNHSICWGSDKHNFDVNRKKEIFPEQLIPNYKTETKMESKTVNIRPEFLKEAFDNANGSRRMEIRDNVDGFLFTTSEEFVRKMHKTLRTCSAWQSKLEDEFPDLFKDDYAISKNKFSSTHNISLTNFCEEAGLIYDSIQVIGSRGKEDEYRGLFLQGCYDWELTQLGYDWKLIPKNKK